MWGGEADGAWGKEADGAWGKEAQGAWGKEAQGAWGKEADGAWGKEADGAWGGEAGGTWGDAVVASWGDDAGVGWGEEARGAWGSGDGGGGAPSGIGPSKGRGTGAPGGGDGAEAADPPWTTPAAQFPAIDWGTPTENPLERLAKNGATLGAGNVGYEMLRRLGWEPGGAVGAGGGRATSPARVAWKDDRKGLGLGGAAEGPQAGPQPPPTARFPTAMARRLHARDPEAYARHWAKYCGSWRQTDRHT